MILLDWQPFSKQLYMQDENWRTFIDKPNPGISMPKAIQTLGDLT